MSALDSTPRTTVFYGSVISPRTLDTFAAWPRALVAINPSGVIDWVEPDIERSRVQDVLKFRFKAARMSMVHVEYVELEDGEFIMPGFVDTHTVSSAICVCPIVYLNSSFRIIACAPNAKHWKVSRVAL